MLDRLTGGYQIEHSIQDYEILQVLMLGALESRRIFLYDRMLTQATEIKLGRMTDLDTLTVTLTSISPEIIGKQLEQILFGARILCTSVHQDIITKLEGSIYCVNGTMGAGKTTLLFEAARALNTVGIPVTIVTRSNEYYRYEPRNTLTSGLGLSGPKTSCITVCEDELEMEMFVRILKKGHVYVFIETLFSVQGDALEGLIKQARRVGAILVFDNLFRFANATIPDSVRMTTNEADMVIAVFGIDAFNSRHFGGHHVFFQSDWNIQDRILYVTGMPNPVDVIKGVFESALFKSCEKGDYLLWTTTLEVIQHLALRFNINLAQFFQQLNESDRFYAQLLREGRLIVPLSYVKCSDDMIGADVRRLFSTKETAYEL